MKHEGSQLAGGLAIAHLVRSKRILSALLLVMLIVGLQWQAPATSPASANTETYWQKSGDTMKEARAYAPSILLAGPRCDKVARPAWCGKVLVVGGNKPGNSQFAFLPTRSVELYDPGEDRWQEGVPAMNEAGGGFLRIVQLLNGKVLVVGGTGDEVDQSAQTVAEVYDPDVGENGKWTVIPAPARSRYAATMTVLAGPACRSSPTPSYCGKVLIAGGHDSDELKNNLTGFARGTAELLDPSNPDPTKWSWTLLRNRMVLPRMYHAAAVVDGAACEGADSPPSCGMVLVVGGVSSTADSSTKQTAELFDPNSSTWLPAPPHPLIDDGRREHEVHALSSGRLLYSTPYRRDTALFDPSTSRWSTTTERGSYFPENSVASLPGGRAIVAGRAFGGNETAEVYNSPQLAAEGSGSWSATDRLNIPRNQFSLNLLGCDAKNGRVLIAGGASVENILLNSSELYDRVPTLKEVSAAANPAGGVTLELSGFFKAITPESPGTVVVKVGGQQSTVTARGDTTITATVGAPAPVAQPGPAEVAVTVDGVPADTCGKKFTLPSVAAVDPPAVPATGETPLRITGSGFTGATKVRIGTVELGKSDFKVADDGLITATAPAGEVGPVQVGVETATGPAVGTATITYHPVVTGVIPPSGSAVGGEAVRLAGRGLAGVKEVRFGSAPAPSASPSGAAGTEATATTPAHDPASVPVTVSAAGLASMPRHGASLPSFTFDPVPVPPNGGEPTPDHGGTTRNDPPPQQGAPPGGNSPGTSPSPGVTPTPAGAPSPGASPSPGAGPSPGASPTPAGVQVPGQAPVNAPVQAPSQAPSQAPAQTSAQASAPPLAPGSAPAPAPGAATNAPSSGGVGNDQGQEKGASRYAMSAVSDHATALGLAGAATAMGVGWLVLSAAEARTVAGCRRSRRRTRARPKGAY